MINRILSRLTEGKFVLIAEVGVNYYDIAKKLNISLIDAAKLMISEAANAGIHAVKFQSYKANTLAAQNSPSYWDLRENPVTSQRELFSHFDKFGREEYGILADHADSLGIEFLSTPFDFDSADYLEPMMNVYKISSSDLSNLPFIEYQAKKGKPIILSVGASNADEIERAVATIRKENSAPLTILHCVLEYPTPYTETNLNKIVSLKRKYPDCYIGYSDHTKPTQDAIVTKAAYLLGAQVIEKHFTLDKTIPGNDHFHSMDVDDARTILEGIELVDTLKGHGDLVCLESEKLSRKMARRSLVSTRLIKAGEKLTADMVTYKRPGTGIPPDRLNQFIGKILKTDVAEDIILTEEMFA